MRCDVEVFINHSNFEAMVQKYFRLVSGCRFLAVKRRDANPNQRKILYRLFHTRACETEVALGQVD